MQQYKSLLCVGGPYSGLRYAVSNESGFSIPVKQESSEDDPSSPDYKPNKKIQIENFDYIEKVFHTPEGDVSFWIPINQTPLETITLLLETYEKAISPVYNKQVGTENES